jgi:hypothetical protein
MSKHESIYQLHIHLPAQSLIKLAILGGLEIAPDDTNIYAAIGLLDPYRQADTITHAQKALPDVIEGLHELFCSPETPTDGDITNG